MPIDYLKLNKIEAYTTAFFLSNYVWEIVITWNSLAKDTVGKQYIRAIDSISANIAEGFGRYGKKDKIHFYRFAQGSLKECFDWNEKAKYRKLLTTKQYKKIFVELDKLPLLINQLIKFTNTHLTI